ncbi:Uncharacterized phage-associated protein [Microlunatus sagamiharensis]|uniref:Uncharacterized phage-associated protein n=1 Tax=Microlunatus sagamiharensis TaxID=546874 RepID=A0A1H2N5P1_9ACTN|nr:type II toxin-antitoxin system antitoxin SocA domain-containing protein [Microlunatus sagamiharensis]SDV00405.1 Uncharacterized phage-associated protein [Microlunatus sagamiharensis]
MSTALEVADFIRTRMTPSGEVQLQKLVYYSQAWNMVWNGAPLFLEEIEAWKGGPVVPSLRKVLDVAPGDYRLDDESRKAISAVVSYYGVHYGWTLSEQTHQEVPWVMTRGDLQPGESSRRIIPRTVIRTFYTAMSLRGEGPAKPDTPVAEAPDDTVLALARRNRLRWADARALLAE